MIFKSLILVVAAFAAPLNAAQASGTRSLTDAEKTEVMKVVKAKLKDPGSAHFRWLPKVEGTTFYCGFVNAKNGYGGYTGFLPFSGQATTFPDGTPYASVLEIRSPSPRPYDVGVIEKMCGDEGYDLTQSGAE